MTGAIVSTTNVNIIVVETEIVNRIDQNVTTNESKTLQIATIQLINPKKYISLSSTRV